ncbi:MAG: aldolase [Duncaniella sp.]|uniref:aldolase/citrate lyase family protein n=1 Tax=Duncaniella sp. TaxID=2518496 RepID=UPI0023C06F2B|nr:aldolase/citrate lyase family protein [Duncaniella sp.]MDE6091307.1 aldolase [Duncaniella sp.]
MSLNLMYITKNPKVAKIAEDAGVDWIFVDMEFIGKDDRQGGLDTVQNHHTILDIRNIKSAVSKAKVLVRVNPIHQTQNDGYYDSEKEIDKAVEAGADIIMLPFFHSVQEVQDFLRYMKMANLRHKKDVKSCLLLETPEAAILIDEILNVSGIDMIHIGLNDLHLAMGMKFMFQLLTDGIVDQLARKIQAKGIPFGFGGIASLSGGVLPGSYILKEHYRLGSSMVIVGRSFCNTNVITDLDEIKKIFTTGIAEMRRLEEEAQEAVDYFKKNHNAIVDSVSKIVENKSVES